MDLPWKNKNDRARFRVFRPILEITMLPLELITHILTVADARTVATMRLTCGSIRSLVDNDLRLPYHVVKLRRSIPPHPCFAETIGALTKNAAVIRAASPDTQPFVIDIFPDYGGMERPIRDLDAVTGRLLDIHAHFSQNIDTFGGLVGVEALTINNSQLLSLPSFPRLTKLTMSLCSHITRMPVGLRTLILENGGTVLSWSDEACASIQHLEVEDMFFREGIFQRYSFPALETLVIQADFMDEVFSSQRADVRWPQKLRRVLVRGVFGRTPITIKLPSTVTHLELSATCAEGVDRLALSSLTCLSHLRIVCEESWGVNDIEWPAALKTLELVSSDPGRLAGASNLPTCGTIRYVNYRKLVHGYKRRKPKKFDARTGFFFLAQIFLVKK